MILAAILGALFFAATGYTGALIGLFLVDRIPALPDAPPQVRVSIPVLVAANSIVGAALSLRAPSPVVLLIIALVCLCLVAVWVVDARRGIVPDVLSLGPLALIVAFSLWQHQSSVVIGAVIGLVPFAAIAMYTKGNAMGWGDVKLAALGGATLGVPAALLVFATACMAAATINYFSGRRRGPIAFAPYLAGAIGLAIPLGTLQ